MRSKTFETERYAACLGVLSPTNWKGRIAPNLIAEELKIMKEDILDFDLYLYDTTPACLWGIHNEFLCPDA